MVFNLIGIKIFRKNYVLFSFTLKKYHQYFGILSRHREGEIPSALLSVDVYLYHPRGKREVSIYLFWKLIEFKKPEFKENK